MASLELARGIEDIASAAGANALIAQESKDSAKALSALAQSLKHGSERYKT